MSFIHRILKKVFGEPRKLHDDFFGEMIDADGYYECFAHFKPINRKIELGIGGDENGPTQEARLFYRAVENDYDIIVEQISPKILETLHQWNPEIRINNFNNEFKPSYLFIPASKINEKNWEIHFETIHDSHLISVVMNGYNAEHVRMDG